MEADRSQVHLPLNWNLCLASETYPSESEAFMPNDDPNATDGPEWDFSGGALREVDADFARMLAQMQTPAQRRGVEALFKMTGREMAEAAIRGRLDPC